jgi:hypothetical protein
MQRSGPASLWTRCLRLTGQTPAVQIANLIMPTEAERAERRAIHARLDAIARRLANAREPHEDLQHPTAPHREV